MARVFVAGKHRLRGFTLMELLVVVAIIALLIAFGTASYSTAQKRGRDSRRISDMKAIQSAFEQYYSDESEYPLTANCTVDSTYLPGGMPVDPLNTGTSVYTPTCDGTGSTYMYCALLEQSGAGNADTSTGDDFGDCDECTHYCVSNLQ